jgi:hypothetical protein
MWLLLVFFGLVSLGQLQRIELGVLPAFYLHDVIIALFLVWLATQRRWWQELREIGKRFPTLGWICLGWAGTGLVFAATQGASITYSLFVFLRFFSYFMAAVGAYVCIRQRIITSAMLRSSLIFFFTLLLLFGALQYFFLPDTRFLFFLGWDDHYYRVISTLFDPGFTGILYVLGYLFLQEEMSDGKHIRPYALVLSLSLMVGVLFTYSRASYLAFATVIVFLTWQKWHVGQARQAAAQAFLSVVFVLCLFILPQPGGEGVKLTRTSTITSRAITAQSSFDSLTSPAAFILGNGIFVPPAQTPSLYTGTTSHAKTQDNWILALLTGTGVVGTVLGLAVLVMLIRWAFRDQRSYIWIALLSVLVHGMFNATITFPFVWIVLLSWGVYARSVRHHHS